MNTATTLALFLTAAVAQGTEAPRISNTSEPSHGSTTITLEPLWTIGEDDDDVLLGAIERVLTLTDGRTLLMDSQLSQVLECSASGEVIREIGRSGDGPGEITNPRDLVSFADGTLGLVKVFPGQLVMLTPDGLPAGTIKLVAAEGSGGFVTLHRAVQNGGTLLLGVSTMTMNPDTPFQSRSFFLGRYDREGNLITEFARNTVEIDLRQGKYNEAWQEYAWSRMGVAKDGTVVACLPRDKFELSWFAPDGTLLQSATLPTQPWQRNKLAHDRMHGILAKQAEHIPGGAVPCVDPNEPAVVDLLVRENGDIWCLTSAAMWEAKPGTFAAYDVLDKSGRYIKRVQVDCQGDATQDRLLFSDNRAYLVTGYWDAVYRVQGSNAEAVSEAKPMSVTCFQVR